PLVGFLGASSGYPAAFPPSGALRRINWFDGGNDMFDSAPTLSPAEIREALVRREIVLIDVREPTEYAVERIHGALLFPLSTFDPAMLPQDEERQLVFHCGSGRRSAT